jgi:hypothetical protein
LEEEEDTIALSWWWVVEVWWVSLVLLLLKVSKVVLVWGSNSTSHFYCPSSSSSSESVSERLGRSYRGGGGEVEEGDLLAAHAAPIGSLRLAQLHRCTCQKLPWATFQISSSCCPCET